MSQTSIALVGQPRGAATFKSPAVSVRWRGACPRRRDGRPLVARLLHRPQNDERPGGRPARGSAPGRRVGPPGGLPAHAEQVERAPVGQRHQLEPPSAVRVAAGEAQPVPADRLLAAQRQLGHVVDGGVEQVRARLAAVKCASARNCISVGTWASRRRERASCATARSVRRMPVRGRRFAGSGSSGSEMPPERVLRFLLYMQPPFEACRRPRVITSGSTRL